MRITDFRAKNFKRIELVEIVPKSSTVLLAGRNKQGKSSTADALMALLCGKDRIPPKPVRDGADEAVLYASTDTGIQIYRTIRPDGGHTFKIEATLPDGTRIKIQRPQEWLDARLSASAFDLMRFVEAKPEEQERILRAIVGIDTSALDNERAKLYEDRTGVNRQARDQNGIVASMPYHPDAPDELLTTEAINADLIEARRVNGTRNQAIREAEEAERVAIEKGRAVTTTATSGAADMERERGAIARTEQDIERDKARTREDIEKVEVEIVRLQNLLSEANATLASANGRFREVLDGAEARRESARAIVTAAEERAAAAVREAERIATEANEAARVAREQADALPSVDESAIVARFSEIEATNNRVRANAARKAALAKAAGYEEQSRAMTARMEAIDAEKAAILARTTFPIPGLGFAPEGGVTYNGQPFKQSSDAEQIQVCMAIALAGSKEMRLVSIKNGSLLDDDSLATIERMAEEADALVLIERVGTQDEDAIVIEDGRVRTTRDAGELL